MPQIVIEPGRSAKHYWKDLIQYRELFGFLAWRDILVRYKQTIIGILWALLRPFLMMIVFTIIFGKLAKFPSGNIPYPIIVFSAMLPWQFFANALTESSNSLVTNAHLISKVYFPRMIIPISAIVVGLIDFLISFALLIALMLWYNFVPTWKFFTLPFFTLLAIASAIGPGLFITALNVKFRDFKHIVPFIVQLGLYISPVGFQSSVIPDQWRFIYSLNPMVGVIDGFRWAICGNAQLYLPGFYCSIIITIVFLISGIYFFRKTEKEFADII